MPGLRLFLFIIIVFLVAFSLRFYDCAYPDFPWLDEGGHVAAAYSYWEDGQFGPDNWEHPPLRHIIQYGFLKVLGDNPYGWRMRNILFGTCAAALTCIFAALVTNRRSCGLMAGLLLATDPLHVVLSRYTWEEVYGGAIFMAAIICYLKSERSNGWLLAAAVSMGCALATKWYYVPGWIVLYLFFLVSASSARNSRTILTFTTVWFLLPAGIYLLSYYQWFERGYTLDEFIQFVLNAYYSLQSYQQQGYNPDLLFLPHSSAWEWFVLPVMVGEGTFISRDTLEIILYANSLPIWILSLPAMVGMAIIALKKKSSSLAIPVLLFCVTYGLCLFVKRPIFIYSAVPILPFAFTAIAFLVSKLADELGAKMYYTTFVLMISWNMYLYPLVTAKKVPVALYGPTLRLADVKIR